MHRVVRVPQNLSDDNEDSDLDSELRKDESISASRQSPQPLVEHCQPDNPRWELHGVCRSGESFVFSAKELVLAVGTADKPRRLDVPGEDLPIVSYGCPSLSLMEDLKDRATEASPLIVVGCGLTAADAVLLALRLKIPVLHVFRRSANDPQLAVNQMPSSVYPEYAHLSRLMSAKRPLDGETRLWDGAGEKYVALARHRVLSITFGGCVLQNDMHESVCMRCTHMIIAVGCQPDLSFLPLSCQQLAIDPDKDVNCRNNPIDVDPFTFESRRVPGLYALGPLVGDNFVRFAIGGALGVTQSLLSRQSQ